MSDKIELHSKVVAAWNSYADEYNQWPSLGEDEKVEYAYQLGYKAAIEDAAKVCEWKEDDLEKSGLTLLEYFAGQQMAAIRTRRGEFEGFSSEDCAALAVRDAKALINLLKIEMRYL